MLSGLTNEAWKELRVSFHLSILRPRRLSIAAQLKSREIVRLEYFPVVLRNFPESDVQNQLADRLKTQMHSAGWPEVSNALGLWALQRTARDTHFTKLRTLSM
jgi:hypothetical protein